jgi:hypothetical protein
LPTFKLPTVIILTYKLPNDTVLTSELPTIQCRHQNYRQS